MPINSLFISIPREVRIKPDCLKRITHFSVSYAMEYCLLSFYLNNVIVYTYMIGIFTRTEMFITLYPLILCYNALYLNLCRELVDLKSLHIPSERQTSDLQ